MHRLFSIILFILSALFTINIYALNDTLKVDSTYIKIIESMTVERVLFIGNDKTKDEVILREMKTKEGEKLNLQTLENDVKRLYNLGLFNRIDVVPGPIGNNKINLVFQFEEMFYFLPIPQGGIKEGSFKKIWGGLNFQLRNFSGKNQTINTSFGIGYEPFISIGFLNPWIFGKHHFFYQFGLKYARNYPRATGRLDSTGSIFRKDDLPTYTLNNFQTDLRIGKFFGENLSISGILSFNSYSTSEYQEGMTVSKSGVDNYPTAAIDLTYDTRDYYKFATYGSYYNLRYSRIGFTGNLFDINKFRTDLRRYIPIKIKNDYAFVLAARYNSVITFGGGDLPVYQRENLGYNDMIRGWDNYVFEGEDKVLGSLELRIPVVKPYYVKGKDHILLRKLPLFRALSYRYGMYATIFFDVGGVWGRKERIFDSQFKNGYGVGLNFLLPFDFVGRTDFAIRKTNSTYKGQIIFSLDASF
ncbi:MAG: POTRA domain-containing protein [Ignavibacteria bacterium]|nr:POTRA domain-containing protein [Ignavibacteria bacterium]